jgi:hypothetical protein
LTLLKENAGLYLATPTTLPAGHLSVFQRVGWADAGSFNVSYPVPSPVRSSLIERRPEGLRLHRAFQFVFDYLGGDRGKRTLRGAGQFTVPSYVLLSLIPTPSASVVGETGVGFGTWLAQPDHSRFRLDIAERLREFTTSVTAFK